MTKKEPTRFSGLFKAANVEKPNEAIDAPSPKTREQEPSARKGKSSDPDYKRTTIYLSKQLHKRLKAAATDEEREISEIVEQLVSAWLENRGNS